MPNIFPFAASNAVELLLKKAIKNCSLARSLVRIFNILTVEYYHLIQSLIRLLLFSHNINS